jgi:hypothetical protein
LLRVQAQISIMIVSATGDPQAPLSAVAAAPETPIMGIAVFIDPQRRLMENRTTGTGKRTWRVTSARTQPAGPAALITGTDCSW